MGVLTIAEVQRVLEKGVSELRNLDCILEKKVLDIRARKKELRLEKEEIEDQLQSREMILKLFVKKYENLLPVEGNLSSMKDASSTIEIVSLSRGLLLAERTDPTQGLRTMYVCIVSTLR
ncbi:unnamed protein product [Sphagnum troendelagicum]